MRTKMSSDEMETLALGGAAFNDERGGERLARARPGGIGRVNEGGVESEGCFSGGGVLDERLAVSVATLGAGLERVELELCVVQVNVISAQR